MRKKMLTRVVFGTIMIIALAALLWLDSWLEAAPVWAILTDRYSHSWELLPYLPLAGLCAALVVLGYRELARMARALGAAPISAAGLGGAIVLGTMPYWHNILRIARPGWAMDELMLPIVLAGVLAAAFAGQMVRRRTEGAFRDVAATMLIATYLGIGGMLILALRVHSLPALVMFLAAVKCTDIGAYFVGSAVGRHKLIPWLSPGKSWEGLAGGLAAGAAAGALVGVVLGGVSGARIPVGGAAALFGAILGLAGQFGDLCESLLKRSCGAKDSGQAVPEFGGVLDILDSLLLSAPVAHILLTVLL